MVAKLISKLSSHRRTRITLAVGGKHDGLHGTPVEVTGMVRLIHEGSFPLAGPMGAGTIASRGRTVVLETPSLAATCSYVKMYGM